MTNDDLELSAICAELEKKQRYAGFFESLDKESKELNVGEELLRSLNATSEIQLGSLENCITDPPDLTCENGSGDRIALEVSEIVFRKAIEINLKRKKTPEKAVFALWPPGDLEEAIRASLKEKDSKSLRGGPYQHFWVCLFTDEMMLTPEKAFEELTGVEFGPFDQITDAFFLFSYVPGKETYPFLRLNLRASGRG